MKKVSDLKKFHDQLNSAFYELEKVEEFPNHFYQSLLSGNNEIYQKSIEEKKIFHEDWISTIESYFPSLDKITKDPKSGLKYLQEVEAIEKAKKINSDSVRHLSANTHLIKEFREGNVVPKKILTTQAEIEYAIYENRFIKTLIERLFDFVNQRFNLIKHNVENYANKFFNVKSNFEIRESIIDLNIDMKIKEPIHDDVQTKINQDLLKRVETLLKQINGLKISPFMEGIKNARPVVAPIMQTSIIQKNVNYRNCYNLWLYLDKYHLLKFDVDVKETNLTFDRYYMRNIYQTMLTTFTTVYGNQKDLEDHYQYLDTKTYTKKSPKFIRKTLDELMTKPDPYILEDTEMNQFYLEQNKKIFEERLNQHEEESSSYDIALRKALRDTMQITNALFQDYFNLNELNETDDMFFNRMVKEDLDEELTRAKEKARIARIIRETKEVDYNNSIRLEKRMLKEIERVNKEINKGIKRRSIEAGKKKAIEEKIRLERQNLEKNQEALSEYLEYVAEQKKVLEDINREVLDKIKSEEKRIRAEEKKIIELEKEKARLKYVSEMKKMRDKLKKQKEQFDISTRKKLKEEKKKYQIAQDALLKASKQRVKSQKAKIEQEVQEKIRKTEN